MNSPSRDPRLSPHDEPGRAQDHDSAPPLIFRALRRDEAGEAARIHRLGMETMVDFEGRHTPEEDRIFYRDTVFRECTITGAFSNGLLIGHVAWQTGWIEHFHVDPAHQGRGVGASLLDSVKSQLDDIQLWTFQTNRDARRFYERHGFRARQYTEGEANDERRPDVRYRWRRGDPGSNLPGVVER